MLINKLNLLNIILIGIGVIAFFIMLYITVISLFEKEKLAVRRLLELAFLLPLPYLVVGLLNFPYQTHFAWALFLLTGIVFILLLLPIGKKYIVGNDIPRLKVDERDIVLSRNLLKIGTKRFIEYYKHHPERKIADDEFRSRPGLLSSKGSKYNPFTFASADASFNIVEFLKKAVDGKVANKKIEVAPVEVSNYIKNWSLKLGARNVGITNLKEYHLYSYIGRGENYGKPITQKHKYAIVFIVEMDKFMLGCAPAGPIVMESAQQYLSAGIIATQIAAFIRNIGYPARAHIDGNYHVLCPLVAVDAGLGEIGRMGLLITPDLGPRVRISVVTTDLTLITDKRNFDNTVIDFCTNCKKCANICPGKAIPFNEREEIDGVKRWQINSEACFTYWCATGTDCGQCIRVCPYSHPDSFFHNLVRYYVRNSSIFRKIAAPIDDFLYGRKPDSKEQPEWMKIKKQRKTNK